MRIELSCRCGEVRGAVEPASPSLSTRIVCYCDDCQAYAHYIGRADLLDANGGTDLVLIPAAALQFTQGADRIVGARMSAKGPYRWRAGCCGSPLGNTVTPALPFVSFPTSAFRADAVAPAFGAQRAAILGQFAVGDVPKGFPLRLKLKIVLQVLGWRLAGRTWPHPFFARETGRPLFPVTAVTAAERERLRPLCGPQPA